MKIYSVYVLQSETNKSYYVGMAIDVQARLKEHNAGKSTYTKSFIPWKLIYSEEIGDSAQARKREKYLKSTAGKNFLKNKELLIRSGVPCLYCRQADRESLISHQKSLANFARLLFFIPL